MTLASMFLRTRYIPVSPLALSSNLETIEVTRDLEVPDELETPWSLYILNVLYIAGHSGIRWIHCLERIEGCQEFTFEYSKHL
jgi:hypothetical protein